MNIIKTITELQEGKDNFIYIDVRTKDTQFITGEAAYASSHIPGAVFLDVKKDLSAEGTFLPNIEALASKLGDLGISNEMPIVLYDQGNQRAAAKAWYVLHYMGHKPLFILQGGFPAWIKAGFAITTEMMERDKVRYEPHLKKELDVSLDEVKVKVQNDRITLIDSRAKERYSGDVEAKYHKAGHIPGAKNYHAKQVFASKGQWKSKQALREHFSELENTEEIIVSCGSGNAACLNLVALKEAGYQNVKLFAGGFSEWIQDATNEVVKGAKQWS